MADPPAVAVAVLAAGRASRFGGDKLDAVCAGKPVGAWVLDAAAEAGLPPGLLVVPPAGQAGQKVAFAEAGHRGWGWAHNAQPERGLASSLALAARWALEQEASALLVLLADMPLLDPAYLRRLADAPPPAATAQPDGRPGVPALIPAALLPHAAALTGDEGAARLLAGAAGLTMLEPPQGMLLDIDGPHDLELAEEMLLARQYG